MGAKTILIIDDDRTFRIDLCEMLNEAGYHVLEAATGGEALTKVETFLTGIDLIVVDLDLPDINGMECIATITRRRIGVKMIATGRVFDMAYVEMMKSIGADESIPKPGIGKALPPEKWLEIVRRLLGEVAESPKNPLEYILVLVDDDAVVRNYMKSVLQLEGFQVLEAVDGMDALKLIRRLGGSLDLVITDINMPRMDGHALMKTIGSQFPTIPFICISGEPIKEGQHNLQNRAFFLNKPFLPKALMSTVREALLGSRDPRRL